MPTTITAYNTFVAGTRAKAAQVNTNFGNHRGTRLPIEEDTAAASHNEHDLGSTDHQWRNVYLQNLPYVGGAQMGNLTAITAVLEESVTAGEVVSVFDDSGVLNAVKKSMPVLGSEFTFTSFTITGSGTEIANRIMFTELDSKRFAMTYTEMTSTTHVPKIVVGTVSGRTVSFGTPTTIDTQGSCPCVVRVGTEKVAVAWHGMATAATYLMVGTITSDTVAFGTRVEVEGGPSVGFDHRNVALTSLNTDQLVITWRRGSSVYQACRAYTIAGTVLTGGSVATIAGYTPGGNTFGSFIFNLGTDSFGIISINSGGNIDFFYGTVSSLAIGYGSSQRILGYGGVNSITSWDVAKISSNEFMISTGFSNTVGSILTSVKVENGIITDDIGIHSPAFGAIPTRTKLASRGDGRFVAAIKRQSAGDGLCLYGEKGPGFVRVLAGPKMFETNSISSNAFGIGVIGSSFLIGYADAGDGAKGKVIAGVDLPVLGIANQTGSIGTTITVSRTGMVSSVNSGLTTGRIYYTQVDGTVGLAPQGERLGIALSSTEILLGS